MANINTSTSVPAAPGGLFSLLALLAAVLFAALLVFGVALGGVALFPAAFFSFVLSFLLARFGL